MPIAEDRPAIATRLSEAVNRIKGLDVAGTAATLD